MSFIFGGNTNLSYDDIQRKRAIADSLLAGMGTPRNVGEGLSAIGKALAIRGMNKQASKADAANRDAFNSKWANLFGGGAPADVIPASASTAAPIPPRDPNSPQGIADGAMAALGKTPMGPYRDAIASIESAGSGDYGAVGPTNPNLGRALGRYQIMEANIGPWSKEALGREITADEFLANPQLQDAIFDHKFGGYVQQFGPEGAAQAWFAGPGGVGQTGRKDVLGTSVGDYTNKFTAALGGQPSGGFNMATLAEIAGDPYASPGQKAVVEALLQQQLNASDPAYRLGLEKQQLELDALRNPQQGFSVLGNDEEASLGLDPAGVYQRGPDGRIYPLEGGDSGKPEMVRQREELARIAGLEPGTPEYQQFMLTGNTIGRGANEYGLQPIIGQDENGNVVIMQLGKDGTAIQTQLPEGVSPNLGLRREEEARGAAAGKAAGEAMIDLPGARITADRTLALVDELYNDPYLDRMVGPLDSALPNVSASAARVQGRMDQLQGTAFLEAYNMLRGGGQITEVEGKKAEAAMARLKTAQNEEDYRAALMDFRNAVETGIRKLEARAGGTAFRPEETDGLSDDEMKYLGLQ